MLSNTRREGDLKKKENLKKTKKQKCFRRGF
jgi:hypothetical protein